MSPAAEREVPLTDEAAALAYRSLPWRARWRLQRTAYLGRLADGPEEAAIVAWYARRELTRWPGYAALYGLVWIAALTATLRSDVPWLALGGLAGATIGHLLLSPVPLRGAVQRNHRALQQRLGHSPPGGRTSSIGGLPFALFLVLVATVASWGFSVTLESWIPEPTPLPSREWPFDRADALAAVQDVPRTPPERLVGDLHPEPVPAGVRELFGERVVVGARELDRLPVEPSETCTDGVGWSGQPTVSPVLAGPTWYHQVVVGRERMGPEVLHVCTYDAQGVLADRNRVELYEWLRPGDDVYGGGTGSPAGRLVTSRTVLVPAQASWALADQGHWVLAMPVEDQLAIRTWVVTEDDDRDYSPTIGEIRWADAEGRRLEP